MAYKVGKCLLNDRLEYANITQSELARKLKVTRQQINKYVTNEQGMSLQVAYNIALILHCKIEDLYEWIKE